MLHPRHFVAAGVFLISPAGRFLMVQTFNRRGDGLILPGGMVEENESPAAAASREVAEELGLTVTAGRLLAVEHKSETGARPSSLQFVFAADGTIDEEHELKLQPDAIAEASWISRAQVVPRHGAAGQARMQAALNALDSGQPSYLET